MFKEKYPLSWTFHQNTSRTAFNGLNPIAAQYGPQQYKEYLNAPSFPLPQPDLPNALFKDLLYGRYSCRHFKNEAVTLQQLSNVLFAAHGVTGTTMFDNSEMLLRPIPSGGGLYSLEFYVLVSNVEGLDKGIYHYVHTPPLLEQVNKIELPPAFLYNLFMQQQYVADAPLVIVATSEIERTMKKYADRGYRYILFEAGHAFQNMNLMATAQGMGSLNLGGFFDDDMCKTIGLDKEEEIPLYAMALGHPDGDAMTARIP